MKRIPLTQGKFAIVDDEDYERLVAMGKWQYVNGYASKSIWPNKAIKMHRLIANTPDGFETDHVNGNKLDNRRKNLRACTVSQNQWNCGISKSNTSGFKGVHRSRKRWKTCIRVNGDLMYIGTFDTPIEAARAYNAAAIKYHGEFAKLNEIPA